MDVRAAYIDEWLPSRIQRWVHDHGEIQREQALALNCSVNEGRNSKIGVWN